MKICPNCQTRYTDDSLKFCLQDGTPLISEIEETSAPTIVLDESETIIKPRSFDPPEQSHTGYTTNTSYVEPEEKSNTFKTVAVTVLTMFVLLGAIGTGAWFYFNNQKEIAKNTNAVKNTKTITKQTPDTNKNDNAANNAETPTPTPTPGKTPEIDIEKAKKEIKNTLDSWKNATQNQDEDEYMSFYADRLDYYTKENVSREFVRNDKVNALLPYDNIDLDIDDLTISLDGATAVAVFNKKWAFEGAEKYVEGKVLAQFKFKQVGGKWKIVSEKDLKKYYVNK